MMSKFSENLNIYYEAKGIDPYMVVERFFKAKGMDVADQNYYLDKLFALHEQIKEQFEELRDLRKTVIKLQDENKDLMFLKKYKTVKED